jgi:hypothetical protein
VRRAAQACPRLLPKTPVGKGDEERVLCAGERDVEEAALLITVAAPWEELLFRGGDYHDAGFKALGPVSSHAVDGPRNQILFLLFPQRDRPKEVSKRGRRVEVDQALKLRLSVGQDRYSGQHTDDGIDHFRDRRCPEWRLRLECGEPGANCSYRTSNGTPVPSQHDRFLRRDV